MSLTYLEKLAGRYGSAWLVLQQLRTLNCASSKEIVGRVLGVAPAPSTLQRRYPRSLTDLRWLDALRPAVSDEFAALFDLVRARGLDQIAPNLIGLIAAHDFIRYCPMCLAAGYHAGLFQIAALECCPWHRVPLLVDCAACGQPAWRNAVVSGGTAGLVCEPCSCALGPDDPSAWLRSPVFERGECEAFALITQWLRQADRIPYQWRELSTEQHSRSQGIEPARFRFSLIAACVPLPRDVRDLFAPMPSVRVRINTVSVVAWRPENDRRSPIGRDRVAIIKAIRRELLWRCRKHRRCRCAAGEATVGSLRVLLPEIPWDELCPVSYALGLWKTRFSTQPLDGSRASTPAAHLRPDLSLGGFAHAVWLAFAEILATARWRVGQEAATQKQMQTMLRRIQVHATIESGVAILRSVPVRGTVVELLAHTLPVVAGLDSRTSCPIGPRSVVRRNRHPMSSRQRAQLQVHDLVQRRRDAT